MINLLERRKELNISQQNVADKAKCSRAYYGMVEAGKRGMTVKLAKALAPIFKVNWPDFFEDER